jgi:hypothetical protein
MSDELSQPEPGTHAFAQFLYDHRDRLPMWTLYQYPDDKFGQYVARLFFTLPALAPTGFTIESPELEPVRFRIAAMGFTPMMRHPNDEPQIMETWI